MDIKSEIMLDKFRESVSTFEKIRQVASQKILDFIHEKGFNVETIESRVKTPESLAGKLRKKGSKYHSLKDITDLVGVRVITFYSDEIEIIADMVQQTFEVDWENSVDKGKLLNPDQFGYRSLHYICRIPESMYKDPEHPEINQFRFEVQMRTALQHIWAAIQHDSGYKSTFDVPLEYSRSMSGLAGLFELVDKEFLNLRNGLLEYREKIRQAVSEKRYADVSINADSFKFYLELAKPFDDLTSRIAATNNMEIQNADISQYMHVLQSMQFKTLADIEKMRIEDSEDAFKLAEAQLGGMDLDIIVSTVGIRNLCIVHLIKLGRGVDALEWFEEHLNGKRDSNRTMAERLFAKAVDAGLVKRSQGEG